MCGIIGILSNDNRANLSLNYVLGKLKDRGPDDQGIWSDRHIQLGHTRLSILDLSPLGHQPMSYQNQRYWITFNGEIYNYLELKGELINLGHTFISQTDTEVLLAAYCQWGKFCLEKLRGMFAFAIWDREEKQLFLARDRIGEKPIYYWYNHQNFYFASELKGLLPLLSQKPTLDPIAVDLYLHYQYVPEPLTPLSGVYKLPAAHYLLIDYDTWEIKPQPYWSLEKIAPVTGNPVELIRQELDTVIELTLRSDVPIGIALSGGVDSGAIAALAAPKYKDTLQAFSIGYPGRPPYDERAEAEGLAKKLGLPFLDIELQTEDLIAFFPELVAAMDDPIADIAAYGHYSVMKIAKEHGIKVMLSGTGGDELFWGYAWIIEAVQLTEQKQNYLINQSVPSWLSSSIEQISKHPFYQRLSLSRKNPSPIRSLLNQGIKIGKMNLDYPQQAVYQNLIPDFQIAIDYTQTMFILKLIDKFKISRKHKFILYKCLLLEVWYRQLVDPCSF
ncbi:asparagine synthase (glutamine-hydrolyzing) [Dolichospermum sp. ST_sed1]|nr:asparagine synthase (glutamine-hydrolyzing) [Dolichospermum sp. ST_sed1]MDD1424247.1 asparagine synthase (glutamine-hydrolyzing) [Dolichospermum sp. ST_sed9]MDD1429755.1 asparagine synthase (glutamine-hydrolyzing) [Dolichospermum sp. ST_sed6]MDD1440553.1 asparagine synthase (glutamine-hydrolyzing) [Dolichospermum sp. ST_sed3]MDD1446109.1 asparagine synthase (glutamine-hydrolyzing) [Dolichospermum sp. ST_sed8]MDD1454727.1 asparagine synthase (glutamine-hydrolyzing) [Dolichospermum sp. ST_sed